MGFGIGLLNGFKWALFAYSALSMILIPLASSSIACATDKGCDGIWTNTGGMILAQNFVIQDNIEKLTDEDAKVKYPEKYDADYIDYLKTKIVSALIIKAVWVVLLFLLYKWIGGSKYDALLYQALFVLFAFISTEIMGSLYSVFIIHQPVYPFVWFYKVFVHFDFIFASGPVLTHAMLASRKRIVETFPQVHRRDLHALGPQAHRRGFDV